MELGFRIPKAVFRIPKPRIPDFAREISLISDLTNKKFPESGIRNPDFLSWGDRREKIDILRFWETAHLPSPKPTLTLTSYLEQNVGLGEG